MLYYRNMILSELIEVYKTGMVQPKDFESNKDSDAPDGKFSFWFDMPLNIGIGTHAMVISEIPSNKVNKSNMRFTLFDDIFDRYDKLCVPEYYTDISIQAHIVCVSSTINSYLIQENIEFKCSYSKKMLKVKYPLHLEDFDYEQNKLDEFLKWANQRAFDFHSIIDEGRFIFRPMFVNLESYAFWLKSGTKSFKEEFSFINKKRRKK